MPNPVDLTIFKRAISIACSLGVAVIALGLAMLCAMLSLHQFGVISATVGGEAAGVTTGVIAGAAAEAIFASALHLIAFGELPELG